jgi:hypothetical protein
VDCEKSGMADMVFEMIQDADIDTRAEYYKHIVLSGNALCVVTLTVLPLAHQESDASRTSTVMQMCYFSAVAPFAWLPVFY